MRGMITETPTISTSKTPISSPLALASFTKSSSIGIQPLTE